MIKSTKGKKSQFNSKLFLHLLAIIFVVINLSSFAIGNIVKIIPLFDLMVIFYYWFHRKIFSNFFIFFLGLWHDAIIGNFLGLTSICYLLSIKFFEIISNRLFIKENFMHIWYQFIAFSAVIIMLKFLFLTLLNNNIISIISPISSWILTILFYVIMHKFFDYLSERLLEDAS